MDYQDVFMGIIMFSMVAFIFSLAYVNTSSEYHITVSDFSEPYSRLANVSDDIMGINEKVLGSEGSDQGGTSQDDSLTLLVRRSWNALKNIPSVFIHAEGLLTNVFTLFRVHPVITYTFLVIIVAFVVFGIINAIIGIVRR